MPVACPFLLIFGLACPIQEGRYFGVPTVNRTRVVPGGNARVGVAHSACGDENAVRVSHPTAVRRTKVMRDQVGQARPLHGPIESGLPAVVALRSVGGALLSAREEEGIQVCGKSLLAFCLRGRKVP